MDPNIAIIVVAVIGAIATIVAAWLNARAKQKNGQKHRPVEKATRPTAVSPGAEECIGTIEFPVNKSRVPHILSNVEGKCFSLPEGHWLWLVTFPRHFPSFHPQGAKFRPENNHWQGFAAIGADRNESNTVYDLILVMTDDRASTRFEAYLRRARETNKWEGLDNLPAGSMELTRITVYKQKG